MSNSEKWVVLNTPRGWFELLKNEIRDGRFSLTVLPQRFSLVRAGGGYITYSTNERNPSTLWDREPNIPKQRRNSSSVLEGDLIESHQIAKCAELCHGRDDDVHRGLVFFYFDCCAVSPARLLSFG